MDSEILSQWIAEGSDNWILYLPKTDSFEWSDAISICGENVRLYVYYLEMLLEKDKENLVPGVICIISASEGSLTSDSLSDDAGIGYAICLIDIYMGMYYNTIIGWAVYYLFASFDSELPWMTCNNPWNTRDCTPVLDTRTRTNSSTSPAKEFFEWVPWTISEPSLNCHALSRQHWRLRFMLNIVLR